MSPDFPAGNPFRYTGRRYDPETGLYYYRARYYDADLGRFLQVDPIGYEDQWNLYAYVGNNPLNATDPTGEIGVIGALVGAAIGGAAGAIVGGGAELLEQMEAGGDINWAEVGTNAAIGAGGGAITGAVAGSGAGLVATVATGTLYGAAAKGFEAASDAAFGDDMTDRNVPAEMGQGALEGAAGPFMDDALAGGRLAGEAIDAGRAQIPAMIEQTGEAVTQQTMQNAVVDTAQEIVDDDDR